MSSHITATASPHSNLHPKLCNTEQYSKMGIHISLATQTYFVAINKANGPPQTQAWCHSQVVHLL